MSDSDDTMMRAQILGFGQTPVSIGAGGGFSQWHFSADGQWYRYRSQQDMDRKTGAQQQAEAMQPKNLDSRQTQQ